MPAPRGKKKSKRLRRRMGMLGGGVEEYDETEPAAERRKPAAKPIMRRGFQAPMWLNAVIGVVLLFLGVLYFAANGTGKGGQSLLLLVAYLGLAGFYIAKAVRQYLAKRAVQ